MAYGDDELERRVADRAALKRLHKQVGAGMPRLIADFHEGILRSIAALEKAVRSRAAAAMVIPAHTIKGDALQFGAGPLAELAETIEVAARRCVETQSRPDPLITDVLALRPLLDRTMVALAYEAGVAAPAPAAPKPVAAAGRPVFGRKLAG